MSWDVQRFHEARSSRESARDAGFCQKAVPGFFPEWLKRFLHRSEMIRVWQGNAVLTIDYELR